MELLFSKMHGLGNDFVVIDGYTRAINLNPEQIRFLADRHRGVGCDQLLLVERPTQANVDFRYRIFNQDGGEVEQCGNGARCFARFVVDKGLTDKHEIAVETAAGVIYPRIQGDGQVTVDMGSPNFVPQSLPMRSEVESDRYHLVINGNDVEFGAVSMGNPHAVIQVEDVANAPVAHWGPLIESHPRFPARVNVGFMQLVDRGQLRLRVFERGVGETQACGTGACAAVAVARRWGLVDNRVAVDLPGGRLRIDWDGPGSQLFMTGPAEHVFEGRIDL